jgi:hypothetical protein
MNRPPFVSEAELEQLYSDRLSRIAGLLKIQSAWRSSELKRTVFRIARTYDAGLVEAAKRPYNRETRKSLEKIVKLAHKLSLAIADADHYARADLAWALSKDRKERKLSTGEEVLAYGHDRSNEWIFDKESLEAFVNSLISAEIFLEDHIKKLGRGGRPRGPEQSVIKDLEKLWIERHGGQATGKFLGNFVELCELTLRPIANRRGATPDLTSIVHNVLYGTKPVPDPWEV